MAAAHDFSTWPRRGEAAKRLGISVATLRRYEGKLIHPIKDKNGEHRFDPQELDALAEKLRKRGVRKAASKQRTDAPRPAPSRDAPPEPRVSGATTKRAFEMFEQKYSRARVTIELGEPIENVNWLHENYLAMSGKAVAPAAQRAAGGGAVAAVTPRREEYVVRSIDENELRSRPRRLLNDMDLDLLQWIEKDDAERALLEEKRRAVRAERAASGADVTQTIDEVELRARPRESLTPAERELVEIIETLFDEESRSRTARRAAG